MNDSTSGADMKEITDSIFYLFNEMLFKPWIEFFTEYPQYLLALIVFLVVVFVLGEFNRRVLRRQYIKVVYEDVSPNRSYHQTYEDDMPELNVDGLIIRKRLFLTLAFLSFCFIVFAGMYIMGSMRQEMPQPVTVTKVITPILGGSPQAIPVTYMPSPTIRIFEVALMFRLAQYAGIMMIFFALMAWRNGAGIRREEQHYEQMMMMYQAQSRQHEPEPSYREYIPPPTATYHPQKTVSLTATPQNMSANISTRNEIITLVNNLSKYQAKRTNNLGYDFDLMYQGRVVGVGKIINHEPQRPDILELSNIRYQQKAKLAYLFTTVPVTDEMKEKSEFQKVRLFGASDIATMRRKSIGG